MMLFFSLIFFFSLTVFCFVKVTGRIQLENQHIESICVLTVKYVQYIIVERTTCFELEIFS